MKKRIVICLLVLAVLLSGCSASRESGPRAAAQRFINAIEDGDMDTMKECLSPSNQKTIDAIFNVADGIMSIFGLSFDTQLIAEAVLGTAFADSMSDELKLYVGNVEMTGKDRATAEIISANLEYVDVIETLDLIKVDGKWYVHFDTDQLEDILY